MWEMWEDRSLRKGTKVGAVIGRPPTYRYPYAEIKSVILSEQSESKDLGTKVVLSRINNAKIPPRGMRLGRDEAKNPGS